MLRIASFDIGKKNFAEYVEECDITILEKLQKKYDDLPFRLKRRVKGQMNENIKSILNEIFLCGKMIHVGVFDLRKEEDNVLDMRDT